MPSLKIGWAAFVTAKSATRRWRNWLRSRFSRPAPKFACDNEQRNEIDAFARKLDLAKLTADQFVNLLETLHMLGASGAGVELSSLTTQTLVDIVSRSSKEQLKAIATHKQLRSIFLDEIFRRMSEHLIQEKANKISTVVGWRFTEGSGEDGFDRYQTVIEEGACVSSASLGRTPDTTVTVSADDFIRMATGNVFVATMFVTGRVKVNGDYAPAVRFSSYFDIPKPS